MEINRYKSELLESNMYIVSENSRVVVIDPFQSKEVGCGSAEAFMLIRKVIGGLES